MDEAKARVLAHHRRVQGDDDVVLVEDECFAGAPPAGVWYRWNYLGDHHGDPIVPEPESAEHESLDLQQRIEVWAAHRSWLEQADTLADSAAYYRASDREALAIVTELAERFRQIEAMEASAVERSSGALVLACRR